MALFGNYKKMSKCDPISWRYFWSSTEIGMFSFLTTWSSADEIENYWAQIEAFSVRLCFMLIIDLWIIQAIILLLRTAMDVLFPLSDDARWFRSSSHKFFARLFTDCEKFSSFGYSENRFFIFIGLRRSFHRPNSPHVETNRNTNFHV